MSKRKKPFKKMARGGLNTNRNNSAVRRRPSQKLPQTPMLPRPGISVPMQPNPIQPMPMNDTPFGQLNPTTNMSPLYIQQVLITNVGSNQFSNASPNDWIGVFTREVGTLIGAQKWDTTQCSNGICDVIVYGVDNNNDDYAYNGDTYTFKFYHHGSDTIIDDSDIETTNPSSMGSNGVWGTWNYTYQTNQSCMLENFKVRKKLSKKGKTPESDPSILRKKGGKVNRGRR